MARTKTLRVLEEEQGGETIDGETLTEAQADAEKIDQERQDEVLRALTEVEGAAEVAWQVWRTSPQEKAGYVTEFPTAELTLGNIRKICGPGKYKITGFYRGGRKGYAGQRTLTIADTMLEANPMLAALQLKEAPSPQEQAKALADLLEQQQKTRREDFKFWAGLIATAIAPALPSLIDKLFKRKDSLLDQVAALRGLNDLTERPRDSAMDRVKEVGQIIESVKALMPENGKTGSTWPDLIREAIAQLPATVNAMKSPLALPASMSIQPTLPPPAPSATPAVSQDGGAAAASQDVPTIPSPPGDPMLATAAWLSAQVPFLIEKAAHGRDPVLYADLLIDNVPSGTDPAKMRELLSRADWWDYFVKFNPPVAPYQPWFTQMRDALIESLDEIIAQGAPK